MLCFRNNVTVLIIFRIFRGYEVKYSSYFKVKLSKLIIHIFSYFSKDYTYITLWLPLPFDLLTLSDSINSVLKSFISILMSPTSTLLKMVIRKTLIHYRSNKTVFQHIHFTALESKANMRLKGGGVILRARRRLVLRESR